MKLFSLFLLLAVSSLCRGQSKTLTIVKQGLCDVKNLDCIRKSEGNNNSEWPSGWIEMSTPNIKIYYSGGQKSELVADITITKTISDNDSYGVFEGFQKLTSYNTKLNVIVRFEYPTTDYNRSVIYYHYANSSLGNYYVCKAN